VLGKFKRLAESRWFNHTHTIAFLDQCFLGTTNGGSDGRVFFMLDSIDDSVELLQRRVEAVQGAGGFDLEHDSHLVGSQRCQQPSHFFQIVNASPRDNFNIVCFDEFGM